MSHRYGTRSLPTRIIAKEYHTMKKELNEHHHFDDTDLSFSVDKSIDDKRQFMLKNLFLDCYELDMNEIPFRYKLKELDKLMPNYNEKDPKCDKIWKKIEKKLGNIFRKLALICFQKKTFTETEMTRYFVSVTEKEIYNGILNGKNLASNVLCFIREIDDIEKHINTNIKLAKRFIDLDAQNQIDQSSLNLLNDLKYKKIPDKLPQGNIFKFNVNTLFLKNVFYYSQRF